MEIMSSATPGTSTSSSSTQHSPPIFPLNLVPDLLVLPTSIHLTKPAGGTERVWTLTQDQGVRVNVAPNDGITVQYSDNNRQKTLDITSWMSHDVDANFLRVTDWRATPTGPFTHVCIELRLPRTGSSHGGEYLVYTILVSKDQEQGGLEKLELFRVQAPKKRCVHDIRQSLQSADPRVGIATLRGLDTAAGGAATTTTSTATASASTTNASTSASQVIEGDDDNDM